jgi:hypothetical protein
MQRRPARLNDLETAMAVSLPLCAYRMHPVYGRKLHASALRTLPGRPGSTARTDSGSIGRTHRIDSRRIPRRTIPAPPRGPAQLFLGQQPQISLRPVAVHLLSVPDPPCRSPGAQEPADPRAPDPMPFCITAGTQLRTCRGGRNEVICALVSLGRSGVRAPAVGNQLDQAVRSKLCLW